MSSLLMISSCKNDDNNTDPPPESTDYFAVANRNEGTVTIYDADTQGLVTTITISDANAAPTYVVFSRERDRLYVADFNNEKVSFYNTINFTKEGEYATGMGSFHMWLNDAVDQLWVNNITDKTTTVIDLNIGIIIATIDLPTSIEINTDTAQHDVTISPDGEFAYISVFSQLGLNYVLQYGTNSLSLIDSEVVGGDPHLLAGPVNLFVLSQDDSNIREFNYSDLTYTGNVGIFANAHGVTLGGSDNIFVSNISDRKVASYDIATQTILNITDAGSTAGAAHNLAYNPDNGILALTLSGSNTVDFFKVDSTGITFLSSVVSGDNPFGIVYIDR